MQVPSLSNTALYYKGVAVAASEFGRLEAGRTISLVPSVTQTLVDLGAGSCLVGRTAWCPVVEGVLEIGGTKNPNLSTCHSLMPTLYLAVKEENRQEDVLALSYQAPVLVFDVVSLADSRDMVLVLGQLYRLGRAAEVWEQSLPSLGCAEKPILCLYLIWRRPYMTVGGDTYIYNMLQACGFASVTEEWKRYPAVTGMDDLPVQPKVVLASSEPYPYKQKHLAELEEAFSAPALLVDGAHMSWHGTRMAEGLRYGRRLYEDVMHTGIIARP